MEKTIKIGNKEVRLNNNIGWAFIYRDQFGRDIVPAIMPMFASVMDVISGIVADTGKVKDITIEDVAKTFDGDALMDAVIHLGNMEFVDFINITWALAKCADDSIKEPAEWVKDFEEFPLDTIAPEVIKLIAKGVISSKNLERLKSLAKTIQPSSSTQSSSQELKED